jgi:FAD:protein FMN transferase
MPLHKLHFRAMGGPCELQLWAPAGQNANVWMQAAAAEVARIEAKYSRYQAHSVISQINQAAGGAPVQVDDETAALLDFSGQCHVLSGGRFDITSGVLRRAWNFSAAAAPQLPSDADLAALLPLVGWQHVQWQRPFVRLMKKEMQLDFGGFGKEYAADRAAGVLLALGATHALVNLGGDVRVTGPQADGTAWRIGIQHPRKANALLASVEIRDGALATSGDYERYLIHDGQRYSHLLDPRTGWPVRGAQSISVQSPLCVFAGALASCAMLMGDAGLAYLRGQEIDFLWVSADGSVIHGNAPQSPERL